jgi:NAD(P)-dependent dehydrogenase (short-subunit alcohol dehydrogenase family)
MSQYDRLFRLDDRVAVVTGGGGILGTEFCTGLAAYGAAVAVVDIDGEAAQELAQRLDKDHEGKVIGIECDVSNPDSVAEMVEQVVDTFGRIDVLHNNAATKSEDLDAFFAPYETYSLEEWRKIMAVNLDGMFLVSQTIGGQMIEQDTGGSIIQTASIYGIVGPDERIYEGSHYLGRQINNPAVYSASKGAVVALSRHLATTWAKHNIRVNTLIPGGVESGQNETFKEKYGNRVPMGRMADRHELVGALLFLASEASSYVTGQDVIIDGGLTAW